MSNIIVQKFGGTSLSTKSSRSYALEHIEREIKIGMQVVVVVSALGRDGDPYATDGLLSFAQSNSSVLPARERDLLLICGELISAVTLCTLLLERNVDATVFTGAQAGIVTDQNYGHAKIESVHPERIQSALRQGKVAIVAGFQGNTTNGEWTTLGRGGSDTTATALGAALRAKYVDIYTDVDGILTADPRIVADAVCLEKITYHELANMALHGAKVIHPRAVEIAMKSNLALRIRSTFSKDCGTVVTAKDNGVTPGTNIRERVITGIASVSGLTQIQVKANKGQYDISLQVFRAMAQQQISVDFIHVNPSGLVYTVFEQDREKAVAVLKRQGFSPQILTRCAKIAVVGAGMAGVPGIIANIVETLMQYDIQILQTADSNTTIWILVHESDLIEAVNALHNKFMAMPHSI